MPIQVFGLGSHPRTQLVFARGVLQRARAIPTVTSWRAPPGQDKR